MNAQISLREWISRQENGDYDSRDRETMCAAGWYDWFCDDKALFGRLRSMTPKVKRIAKSVKIDPDAVYVFFKNNCPMWGDLKLYDDFRICDLETGNVLFTVTPRDPEGNATVSGRMGDEFVDMASGTMKDVYGFFGV